MIQRVDKKTALAVIGGGLSGKIMALALMHSGYDVTLFAPHTKDKPKDRRSTTIHAAGKIMLDTLGVTDRLAAPMTPIHMISVAIGPEKERQSDWLLQWQNQDMPMAYVVENYLLDEAIEGAMSSHNDGTNLTLIDNEIIALDQKIDAAYLEDNSGQMYQCDMIIACDGARSPMRDMAGLKPSIEETNQKAIICNLGLETPHDDRACQRFLSTGPIALMPLEGRAASLVWSTSSAEADRLLSLDDDDFGAALNEAFGWEFGKLTCAGPRHHFPLRPQFNKRLSKGRLLLAGDAAHTIHPLAGMGYNLALADAAILLDELQQAHKRGLCADHPSIATRYTKRRQPEIIAMSKATSSLNRLLSRPSSPLSSLISTSMILLDKTPLKSVFSKIAMGGKLANAPLFEGKLQG